MQQYVCMRTTIEIPDALMKQAKLVAVEQGTTLKALVTNGLQLLLRAEENTGHRLTKPPVKLHSDSPLRQLNAENVARIDADQEARDLNELYRRR